MVYIDESGHTGTQRFESSEWNINGQPYFVLAALITKEQNVLTVDNGVNAIVKKNKIQRELKSTHKKVKKNIESIADDLKHILEITESRIVCEVVNKRYCVVMQVVDYCVVPYYTYNQADVDMAKVIKQISTNYIYENINDSLLGEFVEMFDSNRQDIDELILLCTKLLDKLEMDFIKDSIKETMDIIKNYSKAGLKKSNLFPLADKYKGGISTVAICPHINSLNNIIHSCLDETIFIHDEISDMELAIMDNIDLHKNLFGREIHMSFEKSVKNKCLQFIDIFAGYIRIYVEKLICGEDISEIPDIFKKTVAMNTNIVAPFSEQIKILPNNLIIADMYLHYKDLKRL